jgi:AcrR family transcriptional regulator
MRSPSGGKSGQGTDDRSTRGKIRDAAIGRFARDGIAGTSLRSVAAEAGVAPSHVTYYFGSKAGLRTACDEYLAEVLRARQDEVVSSGLGLAQALRSDSDDGPPLLRYLARTLVEPSEAVDALVDQLLADAEQYMAGLVEAGVLTPSTDPHGRAVTMTMWSLGTLALHDQLARLTGVDFTEPDADPQRMAAYARPVLELFGPGLLTDAAMTKFHEEFTGAADPTKEERT